MKNELDNIYKFNGGYFLKSFLFSEIDSSNFNSKKFNDKVKFLIKDYKKKEKISVIWKNSSYSSDLYKLTQKYSHNIFDSLTIHTPEEVISRLVWIAFILENPKIEEKRKYFRYDTFTYNGTTYIIDDFKKELNQFPKNATIITLPFRQIQAAYLYLNALVPAHMQNDRNLKSLMNYINNNFKDFLEALNSSIDRYIEVYNQKYLLKNTIKGEDYTKLKSDSIIYNKFIEEYGLDPKTHSPIWEIENFNLLIQQSKSSQDKEKFREPYYALRLIHSSIQI